MHSGRPHNLKRGSKLEADFLNRVAGATVRSMIIKGGRVRRVGNSIALTVDPKKRTPSPMQYFRVQSVGNDTLDCYTCDYDGSNVGTVIVKVLHAPPLRRTLWDGETIGGITYTYSSAIARSADNGVDDAESQVVTPDYETADDPWEGEIIKAIRMPKPVTIGSDVIYYEEMADGRGWRAVCA